LRDLIIGVTLALPDGTIARSGGKVVKNVAGYDLPKLVTGSLGTLGIITQAIFRLHPVPRETRTLSFAASDAETSDAARMNALLLAILDCSMVPTGIQVRAGSSETSELDIRFEGTVEGCEAQIEQMLLLASGARRVESLADVWNARSALWSGTEPSVVCKFSLLPADLALFLDWIKRASEMLCLRWRIVAQGVGVGCLRFEGSVAAMLDAVKELRRNLETRGGSFTILRGPLEIKSKMDVWGTASDTLPLMKRIKTQFDPACVLNPGRLIGGI
jgi:glycolate oxidase FAD binding subunit